MYAFYYLVVLALSVCGIAFCVVCCLLFIVCVGVNSGLLLCLVEIVVLIWLYLLVDSC